MSAKYDKALAEMIRRYAMSMEGVAIRVDSKLGTVTLHRDDNPDDVVFMQGEAATAFINEAESLWERAGEVTLYEVWQYLAEEYVSCLLGNRG